MDQSVSSPFSKRIYWTVEDIKAKISAVPVVVFTKGTANHPRCGFSERLVSVVEKCGKPYEVVDASEERSIGAALKAFSGRDYTLPLVYVNGALVSTLETQERMLETGALKDRIERAFD